MSPFPYSQSQHYNTSTDIPMNPAYEYSPAESSSSALLSDYVPSSSFSLPSDLPDLYYEYGGLPTPPSASTSNMICTPPLEWQTPWQPTLVKGGAHNVQSNWPSSPINPIQGVGRPMIAPIDTSFDWAHSKPFYGEASGLFAGLDDFGEEPYMEKPPSYLQSQGLLLTQPVTSFNLTPPRQLPETVSPSALSNGPSTSLSYAPSTAQAPLKLHQPRPSRRIPIISLDQLASACDNNSMKSFREEPLSPLPLDLSSRPPLPSKYHYQLQRSFPPTSNSYTTNIPTVSNHEMEKVLTCECGCREAYIFRP